MIRFKIAFSLGDGFWQKIKAIFALFWISISSKIGLGFCEIKLKLFFQDKRFNFFIKDGADIAVLREIFLEKEYEVDISDVKTVIDLGSNIGVSVIYFAIKYPEAIIYAIEPDKNNYERLLKNVTQFNNVKTFNLAISDKNGEERIWRYKGSHISSSLIKRGEQDDFISISTMKLDSFLEKEDLQSVDLLKCDIEGAEFLVFKNFFSKEKVKHLTAEVHEDLSGKSISDFKELFLDKNFSIISLGKRRYLVNF